MQTHNDKDMIWMIFKIVEEKSQMKGENISGL